MKTRIIGAVLAAAGAGLVAACGTAGPGSSATSAPVSPPPPPPPSAVSSPAATATSPAPSTSAAKATPKASATAPSMTVGQQQAVESARGYLNMGSGFSQAGLMGQLTSKAGAGFSKADAEFAINHLHPDWNQQAVESARGYLSMGSGFSQAGLMDQLTSKAGAGFTKTEAEFAINHLHPDWNQQAVMAAKGYLQTGEGFSRAGLISQLESPYGSQFTHAQAIYAVDKVGL